MIPVDLATAISQANVRPFYAIEILFDSAPIRIWTGVGDVTIDGETYSGAGALLSIGDVEQVADLSAPSIEIALSGMDDSLVALSLTEPFQRREVNVWFGAFINDAGDHSEFLAYQGFVNTMRLRDNKDRGTVIITVDSKQLELQRTDGRRYTSESHKSRHPSDTFFDYVSGIQDSEIVWGRKSA